MKKIILMLALSSLVLPVVAAPEVFDFKDPKGVNNVVFRTDAPLESINGTATGVSGSVTFDPDAPASIKGKIVVEAASLRVPNSMMQGHLQSDKWLDVAKYPDITFEVTKVDNVKITANTTIADVTGNFSLHGITNKITVPAKIVFLRDKLNDRFPSLHGDLLVIRAAFTIKRSVYAINKGTLEDKVSDEIALTLSLAGQSPK